MKLSPLLCASFVALAAVALTTDGALARHKQGAATMAPPAMEATTPGTVQQTDSQLTEQQIPELDGIPQMGDHYLCYDVKKPWSRNVTLRDQFGIYQFHVYAITRLCNPVEKRIGKTVTPIKNKALHYVCYRGETHPTMRTVYINNQFGPTMLTVKGPTELCLPSVKHVVHGGPNPTGDQRQ